MEIKTLLNLSESTVELYTVDLRSSLLQDFLKENNIIAEELKKTGSNGYPYVKYSGEKKSLEKMIHLFFGDDDLRDLIEEGMHDEWSWGGRIGWKHDSKNEKTLRVYANKKDEARIIMRGNDVFVVLDIIGAGSGQKFPNVNAATKWLEDHGYELRDLHEKLDPEEKVIRVYVKGGNHATMKKQEDNSIVIEYEYSGTTGGQMSQFKTEFRNANEATKYLESQGWKLDELHESGQVMGKMYWYEQLFKKGDKEAKVVMSDEKHVVVHFSEMFKGAMDEYKEKDFKSLEDAEKFLTKDGWKKDSTWNLKAKKWEKVK